MEKIIQASHVLTNDLGYYCLSDYESYWRLLLENYENDEPVLRFAALKATIMASRSVSRTTADLELQTDLVKVLSNAVNAESHVSNRISSVLALAEVMATVCLDEDFSPTIRSHAFNSILNQFLTVYPTNPSEKDAQTMFDHGEFTSNESLRLRIVYLHAIACCFVLPDAKTPEFINYIDGILRLLIRPTTHIMLKTAAVHILANFLPITNLNRERIHRKFLKSIHIISNPAHFEALSKRPSSMNIASSTTQSLIPADSTIGSQTLSSASDRHSPVSKTSTADSVSQRLKELLEAEISKFWSVWYPKAEDNQLEVLKPQETAGAQLGQGYAVRRIQWLNQCLICSTPTELSLNSGKAPLVTFFKDSWIPKAKSLQWIQKKEGSVVTPSDLKLRQESTFQAEQTLSNKESEGLQNVTFIDGNQLSFNLNPPNVVFNRFPHTRELFIQNKSATEDISFYLQVSPPEFFTALPSFGKIVMGESCSIHVTFTPQPYKPRKNAEVQGFIRIRSEQGLTFERISLKAFNIPALRVYPDCIDFGFCPKNETRTATIYLHSNIPIDCPCIVLISQTIPDQETAFSVPFSWSQPTLLPKEKKAVKVIFGPVVEGSFNETLYIIALGGDVYSVKLRGVGGSTIKLLEHKIDVGPTDIHYSSVSRRLFLENKDKEHSIPVKFHPSSDEIEVNYGEEVILEPGEVKPVNISFWSKLTGLRQENMKITAPNAVVSSIPVIAASGPVVYIPVMDEIMFPTALTGQPSSVYLPIRNISPSHAYLQLAMSPNSPFTVKLIDSDTSAMSKNLVDLRQFETSEASGCFVTIAGHISAVLEIVFKSSTWGTFRVSLTTTTVKPKKTLVATHYLSAIATNEMYMIREKPIPQIRKFLSYPANTPATGLLVKKSPDGKPGDIHPKTSQVFELDPPLQMCFGSAPALRAKSDDIWEYVTLTNLAGTTQPYQLAISSPFYTNVSLQGELEAFASVDIPLRVDPKVFAYESNVENLDKIAIGQVTAFDDASGIVSSSIIGTLTDLVSVEVRRGAEQIQFPPVRVMEKSTRRILIRNKSPLEIVWEGRVVAVSNRTSEEGMTNTTLAEWCPFGLIASRINLKPFDYATVDIQFQATSSGIYNGRLLMTYVDPVYHIINKEYHRTRAKRDLAYVDVKCEVGTVDLEFDSEPINFGDIINYMPAERSLVLNNRQLIDSRTTLISSIPFRTRNSIVKVSRESSHILPVYFQSGKPKFYNSFLWIASDNGTQAVPILANAGFSKLGGNLVEPLPSQIDETFSVSVEDKHYIEFGFVSSQSPKLKVLHLKNLGTFEMIIKNIVVKDNGHLIWKFLDDYESQKLLAAGFREDSQSYWSSKEVDWDEVDYKVYEEKSNLRAAQTQQIENGKGNDRPKKKKGAKAVAQNVAINQASVVHKQFPLRIAPLQTLSLAINFGGLELGIFTDVIRIDTERGFGEAESFRVWGRGNVQPPLILLDKKIEFGNKAAHSKHLQEIRFKNEGTYPLSWTLESKSIKYTAMAKYDPAPLPEDLNSIICPIKVFPTHGILAAGSTQIVEVVFCPSLPEYEVANTLCLKTEDFHESEILIRGVGASSNIVLDKTVVDFGVLRVGTKKVFKIKMHNRGILHTKYFVECGGQSFSADPEEGILEGNGVIDLIVTYKPKTVGKTNSYVKVTYRSDESYKLKPVIVNVLGMASYPDILVLTKVVDFGVALFGAENAKPITIENRGSADADIIFTCSHPAISLETGYSGSVVLPANSKKDIKVIYSPQQIETLDVKVFLRSSDTRGDHFMIQLRGTVGVPKITFTPPSVTKQMDFGVCAVKGHQKRTFTMKNEGNIKLSITMKIEVLSIIYDENGVKRAITSKQPAFVVEPESAVLPIGEEMKVTVTFTPEKLATYEYKMVLKYDFRSLSTVLVGVGGRAIFQIISPLRRLDFGVCRLNRVFRKLITVSNTGNLGVKFHIRPEGASRDWEDDSAVIEHDKSKNIVEYDSSHWMSYLDRQGIRILNPDGFCNAKAKTDIVLEYFPQVESAINIRFRIYFDSDHEDIDILASASSPKLSLQTANNEILLTGNSDKLTSLDLGVHPINLEYSSTLKLVNEGPFALDFLIQPIGIREFDIYPLRGYIEPQSSTSLKVFFNPTSESKFQMVLKVLWEGVPLRIVISGSGGIGKLEVVYIDAKDIQSHCLDFNMVPFNSSAEKRFFLHNVGLVPVDVTAESDNEDYTINQVGEPFLLDKGILKAGPKKNIWNWFPNFGVALLPSMGVEISAKFFSKSPTTVFGHIFIASDCAELAVPMRGKGGTFSISHRGDLSFGDIASNYTYSRKLTISNSGSIPANISLEWLIVGHNTESPSSFVRLAEVYNNVDPRSGFARQSYLRENNIIDPNYKLSAREYWKLVGKMIRKPVVNGDDGSVSRVNVGGLGRITSNDSIGESMGSIAAIQSSSGSRRQKGTRNAEESITSIGRNSRITTGGGVTDRFTAKKSASNHYSTMFKRRQMFFHLITSTQVSSQSTSLTTAFIRVDPGSCVLPSYGEVHLNVDINLSTEDTFLATLLVKSDVANYPPHEITLTATPKAVSILCDDTRMLNFYRQPLGEPEILTRTFTNIGHRDINFRIINTNQALSILPARGSLKVGQSQLVQFIFRPTDESIQNADVIFEPDCSQHIRLKMSGGGGFAKASLSKYRRFDFGHCMIGKDTISLLPITNEGNALLHLTRFDLYETDTFFKGVDWPTSRVSLFPGQSFNLALVFNPHEESPGPGRLVIGTTSESWEIELIGLGREAVLIVSKVSLDFTDCLIGNSYERKLGLKNVGDVNYPVTFTLDREFPDLEFIPPSLVINPFSENYVIVSYTPTSSIKSTVAMTVSSPYSSHKIPISLHSGTATLEFTAEELDFGMFERVTRPSLKLGIKNTGTVKTSFVVRDTAKPSMFQISGGKGLLTPGKTAEVTITHIRHTVCEFKEKLMIKSDLIDNFYYVYVKGQCEESLLKPDEFSLLNLGICPVLDATTKQLQFRNYGKFPLDFTVKSTYPLKCFPLSGHVAGGDWAEVSVSWSPSGGYELRTQLTLATNIGNYNVIVRGKAAFPELFIKNVYLDFGVCGVGYPYSEKLIMVNKGKVPLHFNIPPMRELSYSVSQPTGYLDLKETIEVDVIFKPTAVGRFAHSFIVECKGVSYKEVVVVGIGGVIRLDISPASVDLGNSPCDLRVYHVITLTNSGEVVLHIDWDTLMEDENPTCTLHLPEPTIIMPGRAARCIFGATAHKIGPISAKLVVKSKERSYVVPVAGNGVRIILTEKSRRILESEHLPVLEPTGPFGQEITIESVEHWFKLIRRKKLDMDLKIVDSIKEIMREARKREMAPSLKIEELRDEDLKDLDEGAPATPSERMISPPSQTIELEREPSVLDQKLDAPVIDITMSFDSSNSLDHIRMKEKMWQELKAKQTDSLAKPINVDDVGTISSKFIDLKRSGHIPDKPHPDDSIVQDVIDFGSLTILDIATDYLTCMLEPELETDLGIIVARPPPFPQEKQTKLGKLGITVGSSSRKYKEFPPLVRKARNARTVEFFKYRNDYSAQ